MIPTTTVAVVPMMMIASTTRRRVSTSSVVVSLTASRMRTRRTTVSFSRMDAFYRAQDQLFRSQQPPHQHQTRRHQATVTSVSSLLGAGSRPTTEDYWNENQSRSYNLKKEWHNPSFMSSSTPQEKELWLDALLQQEKNEERRRLTTMTSISSSTSVAVATYTENPTGGSARGDFDASATLDVGSQQLPPMIVDVEAFLVVLRALSGSSSTSERPTATTVVASNPRRAEYWMKRLVNMGIQPTPECYQRVIESWANSSPYDEPLVVVNRAERWLNEMASPFWDDIDDAQDTSNNNNNINKIQPTIECYNAFLDACTRGRQGKNKRNQQLVMANSQKAESILRRLISLSYFHRVLPPSLHPTTTTFNFVIRGISRCKDDDMIHHNALGLVRMMEGFQRAEAQSFNNFHTFSSSAVDGYEPKPPPPPCPNTKTYSMTMDALISVARLKANRYHHHNYYRKNNYLDRNRDGDDYDCDHDAMNPTTTHGYDDNDDFDLSTRMNDNGLKEMEEATSILQYMHDLYDAGIPDVVPHRVPYNILITGWAGLASFGIASNNKSNDDDVSWYCDSAPFKAEEILRTMMSHRDDYDHDDNFFFNAAEAEGRDFRTNRNIRRLGARNQRCPEATPDRISYEKVIQAWANSGHPNSGKRALWWLKQLWTETEIAIENGDTDGADLLRPTTSTYNLVMKALASSCGGGSGDSSGALEAENLLLDLGDKYRTDGLPGLRPNSESFSIVIRSWLQASHESRGPDDRFSCLQRAVEWLDSLREVENENDLSTAPELFISVLKAAGRCAYSRPDVMDLATETFEAFRNSRHQMDGTCYSMMLKVGLQACSGVENVTEREEFLYKLVEECCEDGLINNVFVRTIANHNSYDCRAITQKYFHHWPLPTSWSRNVKNLNTMPSQMDLRPHNDRPSVRRRSHNHRQRQSQQPDNRM